MKGRGEWKEPVRRKGKKALFSWTSVDARFCVCVKNIYKNTEGDRFTKKYILITVTSTDNSFMINVHTTR